MKCYPSLCVLAIVMLCGYSNAQAQVEIKAEVLHESAFVPPPIGFMPGEGLVIAKMEVKGKWEVSGSPLAAGWPYQVFDWFTNPVDDNPLAALDWTGVVPFDTTWSVTDQGGSGEYKINKKIAQEYKSDAYTAPGLTGWMAPNAVYNVDISVVAAGVPTFLETFDFDVSGASVDFAEAKLEVKYEATGEGDFPVTSGVPNTLGAIKAESKIELQSPSKTVDIPTGSEFLRIEWKAGGVVFASFDYPLSEVSPADLGLNISMTTQTVPPAGFFAAGETIELTIDLTNDGGASLPWETDPAGAAVEKLDLVVSGPKNDYLQVFPLTKIVDKFQLKGAFTNPIQIVLPDPLPGGTGTYSALVRSKRTFGGKIEKSEVFDFQVGSLTLSELPVSDANCATCHSGGIEKHGAIGASQCLVCHSDDFSVPLSIDAHVIHQRSPILANGGTQCASCHVNDSHDVFTSDASEVCTACHSPVPYFPSDHAASTPLYAESGMSCATSNCHASGGLGVFSTIAATHAGLDSKYTGGSLTAVRATTTPIIDGIADAIWDIVQPITTHTQIDVKALWDDENIYMMASWPDGHNLMSGSAPASESILRGLWTFDGANWQQSSENEDRLGFVFNMNDDYGASCGKTCHDGGHSTSGDRMDVWHWKSVRSNPAGGADDKFWDKDGRVSDEKTSGFYASSNIDGAVPAWIAPNDPGANADILLTSTAVPFAGQTFAAGNTVQGYLINDTEPIVGSFGDVQAKGVFDAGTGRWTVEFMRALNTLNDDDVVFSDAPIEFTVTNFDNTGGGHAAQGVDVGVYTMTLSGHIDIEDAISGLPKEYKLAQNYPNPFNPQTIIEYSLPANGRVSLRVFNVLGQEVMTLVDQTMPAGVHQVNVLAGPLASGLYLYQLKVNDFTVTKTMMVLR